MLAGVATLPYDPSVVLVADAAKGVIWQVNTATGNHTVTIDDPTIHWRSKQYGGAIHHLCDIRPDCSGQGCLYLSTRGGLLEDPPGYEVMVFDYQGKNE